MAKYGKKAHSKVHEAMHEMKEGKLRSGSSGKKVKNPKQAIAIGLSEARREGDEVPSRKSKSSKSRRSSTSRSKSKSRGGPKSRSRSGSSKAKSKSSRTKRS